MLVLTGGGSIATPPALLLLNIFVGDLRVEPAVERSLQAAQEAAVPSGEN
jgi:hypothetical protein